MSCKDMRPISLECTRWRVTMSCVARQKKFNRWVDGSKPSNAHGAVPGLGVHTAAAVLDEAFRSGQAIVSQDFFEVFDTSRLSWLRRWSGFGHTKLGGFTLNTTCTARRRRSVRHCLRVIRSAPWVPCTHVWSLGTRAARHASATSCYFAFCLCPCVCEYVH